MAGLISNGSYVLSDTVVDVFHDNSLTGNGTENNPLNVNTDVIATKEDVEACVKDSDIVVNSDGFINSINGSYLHSQTSWKDSAGNIIKSTYATKTELANKIQVITDPSQAEGKTDNVLYVLVEG